jgi:hypothetical protein
MLLEVLLGCNQSLDTDKLVPIIVNKAPMLPRQKTYPRASNREMMGPMSPR